MTAYPAATPPSLSKYRFVRTMYPPTSFFSIFWFSLIKYPSTLISLITDWVSSYPFLSMNPTLGTGFMRSIKINSFRRSGAIFSNSARI